VAAGDRWVLCSDGLYDVLAVLIIAQTVSERSPDEACQTLIEKALAVGAPDNVSVGVFSMRWHPLRQTRRFATACKPRWRG